MTNPRWPALPYDEWKDTYATLHMWTQVVGKVALALAPPINHSWGIALDVTPRGLTTQHAAARRPLVHHRVRLHRPSAPDRDVGRRRAGRCRSRRDPSPTSIAT